VNFTENLTYKKIFLFWGPLALTWLMMSVEQPFLVAVIARLGDAKHNLAAFGIAFSFALIIEAPVIMLMSASTALVGDSNSLKKMKRFTDLLNASVTIIQLLILIPPVFNFIVQDLMEVPDEVAQITYYSLALLLPWPAAIGYRRFYQGILIRNNLTRRVTYGTLVRLSAIAAAGLLLYKTGMKGAYVGSLTLSIAVMLEAVASWVMARKTVSSLQAGEANDGNGYDLTTQGEPLRYRFIARFYFPLALTSLLSLGVNPFVTFFMGRSQLPVESLAVLPAVNGLVFIFRSMGLSFQEVNIALIGARKQNYRKLRNFAIFLGTAVTILLAAIAFTPLARLWFENVSGLTYDLSEMAYLPVRIMILLPALSVLLSFQRSTLVVAGRTRPISVATAVELIVIVAVLLASIIWLDMVGVIAATIAYVIGKSISNIYLGPINFKVVRKWQGGRP
jgi:O-antigen/teichoic acid export membrane protein